MRTAVDTTATFKHTKSGLIGEGYDPRSIADPIFFHDGASRAFVRLDAALYDRIRGGEVRL